MISPDIPNSMNYNWNIFILFISQNTFAHVPHLFRPTPFITFLEFVRGTPFIPNYPINYILAICPGYPVYSDPPIITDCRVIMKLADIVKH